MSTLPSMAGLAHRGPERRRHARFRVIERQLVTVDMGAKRRGLLVDISMGGAAIQPYEPMKLGDRTAVQFAVPGEHTRVEANGVVTWLGTTGRAGVQFLELAESTLPHLKQWIESMAAHAVAPVDSVAQSTAAYLPPSFSPWIKVRNDRLESNALEDDMSSLDLVSALRMVVERARSLTHASGAAIALSDGGEMVCRARTGVAPDLGARFRPDSGLSGEAVRAGTLVHCTDTATDSRVDRLACERLNVRSILIVPILSADAIIGVIEVFSPAPGAFSGRDTVHVERLASLTSAMLESSMDPGKLSAADPMDDAAEEQTDSADLADATIDCASPVATETLCVDKPVPVSSSEVVDFYNQFTRSDEDNRRRKIEILRKTTLYTVVFLVLLGGVFGASRWSSRRPATPQEAQVSPAPDNSAVVELPQTATASKIPVADETSTARTGPDEKVERKASSRRSERWTWIAPTTPGTSSELKLDAFEPTSSGTANSTVQVSHSGQVKVVSDLPGTEMASGGAAGRLVTKVDPMFPPSVSTQAMHGKVVLNVVVNADGTVDRVDLVSGNEILGAAVVQAVKKWRYEPYLLDGRPTPIEKTITISFAR